jgi:hypothetical protein
VLQFTPGVTSTTPQMQTSSEGEFLKTFRKKDLQTFRESNFLIVNNVNVFLQEGNAHEFNAKFVSPSLQISLY